MANRAGVYDIKYAQKTSIKGQAVVDVVIEIQCFEPLEKERQKFPEEMIQWTLNIDGASNKKRVGMGIILELTSGVIIEEGIRLEE